jgi:hypothetical protein
MFCFQEIVFLSQFQHPNIVQYYGCDIVSFLLVHSRVSDVLYFQIKIYYTYLSTN